MTTSLAELNENQRAAVEWGEGPMLALAGPGSGKTSVLTLRMARLLSGDDDLAVLALTFTRKAAAEMRGRVEELVEGRTDRARLCTFHSFAADTLRQHGRHVGLRPDFAILAQDEDRIALLEDVIARVAPGDRAIPSDRQNLLRIIDRLLAEGYEGEQSAPFFKETPPWLPILFDAYVRALVSGNRTDYGTLIALTCQLLRTQPAVARAVRLGWSHVCVDEFQDTNKSQYDLLRLLAPGRDANLFVVADDDQILFQWNGASPERLHALTSDYDAKIIQLPANYRCPGQIVDLANKLIAHNIRRATGKDPLSAARGLSALPDVVRVLQFSSLEAEATGVAEDIKNRQLRPKDCVVLARTRKTLQAIANALQCVGLEVYMAQRKADFEHPVTRTVFQAMRLANAPHDRDSLRRLCVAWQALTDEQIEMESVAAASGVVGGNFLRAWTDAVGPAADVAPLALVARVRGALVDRLEFPGIVDWFLREGALPWVATGDDDLASELEVWRELHRDLVDEYGAEKLTLNSYLQAMDLAPKTSAPGPSAIRCLTVHGAKGLEFQHVYLVGLAQDILPSYQAVQSGERSRALEEERRSCFVAITRTRETLTLSRAQNYFGYNKAPSQFLAEMGLQS